MRAVDTLPLGMGLFLVRALPTLCLIPFATLRSLSLTGLDLPTHFILMGPLVHSRVRSLQITLVRHLQPISSVPGVSATTSGFAVSLLLVESVLTRCRLVWLFMSPLSSCSTPSLNAGTALDMARTTPSSQAPETSEGLLVTSSPRGDGRTHGGGSFVGRSSVSQARLLGFFRLV